MSVLYVNLYYLAAVTKTYTVMVAYSIVPWVTDLIICFSSYLHTSFSNCPEMVKTVVQVIIMVCAKVT